MLSDSRSRLTAPARSLVRVGVHVRFRDGCHPSSTLFVSTLFPCRVELSLDGGHRCLDLCPIFWWEVRLLCLQDEQPGALAEMDAFGDALPTGAVQEIRAHAPRAPRWDSGMDQPPSLQRCRDRKSV